MGYLDSKYVGNRPLNLAAGLQRAPTVQGKAGASFLFPLPSGALLLNADVYYTDKYTVTPANLAFTAPTLPTSVTPTGPYALVNASIGYRWHENRYEVGVSCTNCLDETYFEAGELHRILCRRVRGRTVAISSEWLAEAVRPAG